MKDDFIKVAAFAPKVTVSDPNKNALEICRLIEESSNTGAKILVFPELCLTGYTCHDLFYQDILLEGALDGLFEIKKRTKGHDALVFVGLPLEVDSKIYNVAAVIQNDQILACIPKTHIPNYNEFYELRQFTPATGAVKTIQIREEEVLFGTEIIMESSTVKGLRIACEICEDVWVPMTPSTKHAMAGANVIVNLSASNALVTKDSYRANLISSTSARLLSGYIYACAGDGESTQDIVFSGHGIIAENGSILAEAKRFENETIYADLDIGKLRAERRRMNTFASIESDAYSYISVSFDETLTNLTRTFDPTPFVPSERKKRDKRCNDILHIQAMGLKKRLEHTGAKKVVIGISGGLDSTLALLVVVRAFDLLDLPRLNIYSITMPCFGTTDRTYDNACKLSTYLGTTLREIDIKDAVMEHFRSIGHDPQIHDVTYENGQARERTQVLMDMANQVGGMVIGTSDLSELALGWATYNGDHMSMYAVNVGVPKTLVRHLIRYYADTENQNELSLILYDVLDTPVSPELLPPVDGVISQITEDLVGPYELHDFFLYYVLRFGFKPEKILRMATRAFQGQYEEETIKKWLSVFYKRFFSQQFKRSCLPDGPKIGSVALSPRGDLRMPSDASSLAWLENLHKDLKN